MTLREKIMHVFEQPKIELFESFLAALGIIWLLVEMPSFFLEYKPGNWGVAYLVGVVVAGLVYVPIAHWPRTVYERRFARTGARIRVEVGDLLSNDRPGAIAVLSSDYLDTDVRTALNPSCLKAQLVRRCFHDMPSNLDKEIDEYLSQNQVMGQPNADKKKGKSVQYPIGTIARVNTGGRNTYIVVGAKMDPATTGTRADLETLWLSLLSLWSQASLDCRDSDLSIPVWGSGIGAAPYSKMSLIYLILASYAMASYGKPVCARLRIVIWTKDYNAGEFSSIRNAISELEL